jgi:uncharacterized protein YjcR|tara:strand:+ start:2255 stop:2521 length:267 start_codon:yes stop_codon:yes gene_type:complete
MQKAITNKWVDDSSFYKPSELGEILGRSPLTVRKWITEGSKGVTLDAFEIGTGDKESYMIHGLAVNKFLANRRLKKNPIDDDEKYIIE